jgi:hypothetical protein
MYLASEIIICIVGDYYYWFESDTAFWFSILMAQLRSFLQLSLLLCLVASFRIL